MRANRAVVYITLFCLLSAVAAGAAQTAPAAPMDKAAVLKALGAGERPQEELIADVKKRGVDFRLTPQIEAELTRAGAGAGLLEAVRAGYRPAGAPLSLADLRMLLELRAPRVNVEKLIETRGVDFAITPQIAGQILAAGGDSALVGLVALHQRAAPKPETPAPKEDPSERGRLAIQLAAPGAAGPQGAGCDLRLWVDHVTDFVLQGSTLSYQVLRGSPPGDAGSSCTGPLPQAEMGVTISKLRGRGSVALVEKPSRANGYAVRLRIEDQAGGRDLYQVRVVWGR